MATSAAHQSKTHEQVEYEQGFLVDNCVPCGAEPVLHFSNVPVCTKIDKRSTTPEQTISTEDTHTSEQRKPLLSEHGRSRTKSAGA